MTSNSTLTHHIHSHTYYFHSHFSEEPFGLQRQQSIIILLYDLNKQYIQNKPRQSSQPYFAVIHTNKLVHNYFGIRLITNVRQKHQTVSI